jgi:hypothetical protein
MLFVSARYCVFCAAERPALVDAPDRFGMLSGITASQRAIADGMSTLFPPGPVRSAGRNPFS